MRIIFTLLSIITMQVAFGQSAQPSAKLQAGMNSAEISALSSEQIDALNYFAEYGFRVHETPKTGQYPSLSSMLKSGAAAPDYSSIVQENFNPLLFDFGDRAEHQFFLIDGTDKVVQIYSASYCEMRYEQHRINTENQKKRK